MLKFIVTQKANYNNTVLTKIKNKIFTFRVLKISKEKSFNLISKKHGFPVLLTYLLWRASGDSV